MQLLCCVNDYVHISASPARKTNMICHEDLTVIEYFLMLSKFNFPRVRQDMQIEFDSNETDCHIYILGLFKNPLWLQKCIDCFIY